MKRVAKKIAAILQIIPIEERKLYFYSDSLFIHKYKFRSNKYISFRDIRNLCNELCKLESSCPTFKVYIKNKLTGKCVGDMVGRVMLWEGIRDERTME